MNLVPLRMGTGVDGEPIQAAIFGSHREMEGLRMALLGLKAQPGPLMLGDVLSGLLETLDHQYDPSPESSAFSTIDISPQEIRDRHRRAEGESMMSQSDWARERRGYRS